jgi:hypothetical protein
VAALRARAEELEGKRKRREAQQKEQRDRAEAEERERQRLEGERKAQEETAAEPRDEALRALSLWLQASGAVAAPPERAEAATEAADADREDADAPEAAPTPESDGETCEILWWRGLVGSEFYARASSANGAPFEAGRSKLFEWHRRGAPPETDEIVAAHSALVHELVRAGWEPVGRGEAWYEHRFRRAGVTAPGATRGA